jgi:hypothetical protein
MRWWRFSAAPLTGRHSLRQVRHLTEREAIDALRRGRSVEQFLGRAGGTGTAGIRYVVITSAREAYEVRQYLAQDIGGEDFLDIGEFPPLDGFEDEDFYQPVAVASEPRAALIIAQAITGAAGGRWVNLHLSDEEYGDYVRAGRPQQWPPPPQR